MKNNPINETLEEQEKTAIVSTDKDEHKRLALGLALLSLGSAEMFKLLMLTSLFLLSNLWLLYWNVVNGVSHWLALGMCVFYLIMLFWFRR